MQKSGFRVLGQSLRFWAIVLLVFLFAQWILMPRMSNFRNTAWIMFPCIMAIICLGLNLIFGFVQSAWNVVVEVLAECIS